MKAKNAAKEPFDIEVVLRRIRAAIKPFKKAMLFELFDKGYSTPFEQLMACLISIRTYDEVSLKIAENLFAAARTPQEIRKLSVAELGELLKGCQFPFQKAKSIKAIADEVIKNHGGELPRDEGTLLAFHGVGPKCANLVLGIACGQPKIGVDIHVHRVTSRWGFVAASSPEKTMKALEKNLPRRYWIEINALLVPFGKHVCRGARPLCGECPVLSMCAQVGVIGKNFAKVKSIGKAESENPRSRRP